MPITSNVAWDERLEAFKGRDTAPYIETVKASSRGRERLGHQRRQPDFYGH
ncbi:hypothetical protein ACFVYC_09165 [Pseudarthrobacter sp. NPDC058329]|uniref:hypothetical protein n=1 Tax=Pseudarthrobacter sp. NPDC058329 TaxID=3346448 RepID=UPI0036DCB103